MLLGIVTLVISGDISCMDRWKNTVYPAAFPICSKIRKDFWFDENNVHSTASNYISLGQFIYIALNIIYYEELARLPAQMFPREV